MNDHEIKPGLWRHYKGGMYEVLFCATHTETEETMVVYRALYGERKLWVRPASMWFDPIPDADGTQRFTFLGTSDCKKCLNPGCAFRNSDWTPDPAVECFGYEPPVTHADGIRTMNDEELAHYANDVLSNYSCPPERECTEECRGKDSSACSACWLDWLRQEAEK